MFSRFIDFRMREMPCSDINNCKFITLRHPAPEINGREFILMESNVFVILLNPSSATWPAPGSEDTELDVFMGPEVSHGETKVYARVQA